MIRPDNAVLSAFGKISSRNKELADMVGSWPILQIPHRGKNKAWDDFYERTSNQTTAEIFDSLIENFEPMFDKFGFTFSYIDTNDAFSPGGRKEVFCYFNNAKHGLKQTDIYLILNNYTMVKFVANETGNGVVKIMGIGSAQSKLGILTGQAKLRVMEIWMVAFTYFLVFNEYINNSDLFPIRVEAEKSEVKKSAILKTKIKGQPVTKSGPSVIFLDKLPTKYEHVNKADRVPRTERGSLKYGHHRRGYYKTLSHPKYANHPRYMVKDGIYIKPTWVGPEQTIYDGNIYTCKNQLKRVSLGTLSL